MPPGYLSKVLQSQRVHPGETIFEKGPAIGGKKETPAPVGGYDFRRRDDDSSGVDVRKECRQNGANLVPPERYQAYRLCREIGREYEMKRGTRYQVKGIKGLNTVLEVTETHAEGYRIRITSVSEGNEKTSEEFITRHLLETCIRTGYLQPVAEAVPIAS